MPQCYSHRILYEVNFVPSKLNNALRCFLCSLILVLFFALRALFRVKSSICHVALFDYVKRSRTSPRAISTIQLHTLLHFHLWPIYPVVSRCPYSFRLGNLVLEGASRLDAFSVYPVRTWLPCYALGRTTGAPAVRPSRSSRTKDSSLQISCAHDR